jgi:hypothetical protein
LIRAFASSRSSSPSSSSPSRRITSGSVNPCTTRVASTTQKVRKTIRSRFDDGDDGKIEERSQSYQRLRHELLEAERRELVELRGRGKINDDVMNRVLRDLDLEEERLDS